MNFTFRKPARAVSRVFVHCSASDRPEHDSAAVIDRWHREKGWAGIGYHFFIRKDGTLELGRDLEKIPAAQEGNNTGTIAICLHGLERENFTEAQFATLRSLCGQINYAYGVMVSGAFFARVTFHGHCEVAKKACPVFDYQRVLGLDRSGRMPSAPSPLISAEIKVPAIDFGDLEVLVSSSQLLKLGSKGDLVRDLQKALAALGYFTGALDGDFGPRTRAAVLAFQADNHLETDGKVGSLTREALGAAGPRPVTEIRSLMSLTDLAKEGSRIAIASRRNIAVGAILGGGGLATIVEDVTGQADIVQRLFEQHGLLTGGVILAAGIFVAWQSWRAGKARVEDHRTGKTA